MKIGIIGSGNMGSGLSTRLTAAGHDVLMTARDLDKARRVAQGISPKIEVVEIGRVSEGVDLIIAATPASASAEALRNAGDLGGKIVVDIANPLTQDMSGLTVGHVTSFAEELAKEFPEARVVKAFNTVFAQIWRRGPDFGGGHRATTFYCGDDKDAKHTIRALIDTMGFDAIDAGPLKNARLLEPLAMLTIYLGYSAGLGTQILPTFMSRAEEAAESAA